MDFFLCLQPCLYRLLEAVIGANIEALSLETYADPEVSIFLTKHTTEAAGIITAVLSVFQQLNTCTIDMMQPIL